MAWPPCPTLLVHLTLPLETFFLFPWVKKVLKGKCFADVEEVKQKTAEALKGIKIDEFFKNYFRQYKKNLDKCTVSDREYFEGDQSFNM